MYEMYHTVYISCAESFDPGEIKKALDDVRAQLRLPDNVILFGISVDDAAPVSVIPESPKPILGTLKLSSQARVEDAEPRVSVPEQAQRSAEHESRPGISIAESDLSIEDILGDITPLDHPTFVAQTSDFPPSVHELAEEMSALSDEDFRAINDGLLSKTARGISGLRNIISFPKTRRGKSRPEYSGPGLFDWAVGAANNADEEFGFPDSLKSLV
ncbi:MAG: hypothetical protein FWD33_03635 [Alphaproteobacteria bacterium]|nr:hypothetical protein [Alphaproteobacteria bacterium]